MSDGIAISMQGLQQARYDFEKASRRIAAWPAAPETQAGQGPDPGTRVTKDTYTSSSQPDLIADLLSVQKAKTSAEANLKALSRELELEKSTLDLLG